MAGLFGIFLVIQLLLQPRYLESHAKMERGFFVTLFA
jgi:hypothetical protein